MGGSHPKSVELTPDASDLLSRVEVLVPPTAVAIAIMPPATAVKIAVAVITTVIATITAVIIATMVTVIVCLLDDTGLFSFERKNRASERRSVRSEPQRRS